MTDLFFFFNFSQNICHPRLRWIHPEFSCFFMLSLIHCGCSFNCLFYPPNPPMNLPDTPTHLQTPSSQSFHPSPCLLFSLFPSSSSSSVAVGTGSLLPAHCYQTMSAFIHPGQHTHPSTDMHTLTQTLSKLGGLPRVKHRSISS